MKSLGSDLMSRSYIRFTAYFRVVDISAVDGKETIERELKNIDVISYAFRGFSRERYDKDCYIICFDITASVDGIQYQKKIGSIVNKLENTGYLDGIKL